MTNDADALAREFTLLAAGAPEKVHAVVKHFGFVLQTRVRAGASGRPGPRAVTGDYRRRIGLEVQRTSSGTSAVVYSPSPQAARLELGWNDIDSLGRAARQPPYPHFGPAFDVTVPEFEAALLAVMP